MNILGTVASSYSVPPLSSIDVLLVAGGGAGGYDEGGGGGAGGYRLLTSRAISTGVSYTATVGAGGAAVNSIAPPGKGTNSSFSGSGFTTISSSGGGGGATYNTVLPTTGGSGGGGSQNVGQPTSPGAAGNEGGYTPVEGYAGGTANRGGAGGGGAGGPGADGYGGDHAGIEGGIGSSTASAWGAATSSGQNVSGTYYFAGGGGTGSIGGGSRGSGPGGYGGGGNGANAGSPGTSGSVNTGGGGGAGSGWTNALAGDGGSGIVIVRYPDTYPDAASTSATKYTSGGYKYYKFNATGSISW